MASRNIEEQLRKMTAEQLQKLDPKSVFQSPEFAAHLQGLADEITKVGGKAAMDVKVHIISDPNQGAGWTNGKDIYVNIENDVSGHYTRALEQFIALRGICFHELGHILFLDFNEEKRALAKIEAGAFYGELPTPQTPDGIAALNEMEQAIADPLYRPIFTQVFNDVTNRIDDPHDEGKLIKQFGGIVEQGIVFIRESIYRTFDYAENIVRSDWSDLEKLYWLILEYARFETILMRDQAKCLADEPLVQTVVSMVKPIATARWTDDLRIRFRQINEMFLSLWPYIKRELEKQEKKQSSGGSGQNQAGSNGQGSDSGAPQQGKDGAPSQNSGTEAVQSVLNQLQRVSGSQASTPAPSGGKSSTAAIQARRAARAGKQEQGGATGGQSAQSADALNALAQAAFNNISQKIAEKQAIDMIERDLTNEVLTTIAQMDLSPLHAGTVTATRDLTVDDSDIDLYDKTMKDLKGFSKRLQKQMNDTLKDLQEGGITHHKSFGNRIEARYAYRLDQRFYADKKLPQDWPTLAIYVLVDLSGSMRGIRLDAAMKATMLLYDFASGLGIPIAIAGHNASHGKVDYQIYTEFDKVGKQDKYRLAHMYTKNSNRDGAAIEVASELLSKRDEDVKLLFIITDGQPNDYDYRGTPAKEDIQRIVAKYRRKGIMTFAAAIGSDKDKIKDIYETGYLDISNLDMFPKQLTKMVAKRLFK